MTDPAEIEELLAATARGDRAAFARLYDATSPQLFGICLGILDDRGDAEAALEDVYLTIWRAAASYVAGDYEPRTWLVTLARNLAIDRLRTHAFGQAREAALAAPLPPAAASAEAARIHGCLATLEEDRAEAVLSAYLRGESYAELARRHGVANQTIRGWMRRGLGRLRKCLVP